MTGQAQINVSRDVNLMSADQVRTTAHLRAAESLMKSNPLLWQQPPVPIVGVSKSLDTKVFSAPMDGADADIASFVYCPSGQTPEITLNEELSGADWSFAVAYQIGHLSYVREGGKLLDSGYVNTFDMFAETTLQSYFDAQGEVSGKMRPEMYASAFALSILMPTISFGKYAATEGSSREEIGTLDRTVGRLFSVDPAFVKYRRQLL